MVKSRRDGRRLQIYLQICYGFVIWHVIEKNSLASQAIGEFRIFHHGGTGADTRKGRHRSGPPPPPLARRRIMGIDFACDASNFACDAGKNFACDTGHRFLLAIQTNCKRFYIIAAHKTKIHLRYRQQLLSITVLRQQTTIHPRSRQAASAPTASRVRGALEIRNSRGYRNACSLC